MESFELLLIFRQDLVTLVAFDYNLVSIVKIHRTDPFVYTLSTFFKQFFFPIDRNEYDRNLEEKKQFFTISITRTDVIICFINSLHSIKFLFAIDFMNLLNEQKSSMNKHIRKFEFNFLPERICNRLLLKYSIDCWWIQTLWRLQLF